MDMLISIISFPPSNCKCMHAVSGPDRDTEREVGEKAGAWHRQSGLDSGRTPGRARRPRKRSLSVQLSKLQDV